MLKTIIVMCIAFGAYQANIALFGIDQLQDASTGDQDTPAYSFVPPKAHIS